MVSNELSRLELSDLFYLSPELTLVIAAVVLSLTDLFLPGRISRTFLGWLSIAALLISSAFVVYFMRELNPADAQNAMETVSLLNQSYRLDDFANLFKLLLLAGTALILFMSIGSVKKEEIPHTGEYYYLFLPATLGGMIMASSADLITLFVGLELLSITTYIMVALRKKESKSQEAAFKYLVNGGIASAFILYGMSFLYGMTGSTNIAEIRNVLGQLDESFSAMIYLSAFLMLAGFAFKIAAAPFHAWAPDVYQGAPTPITGYLAVVSKAAGLAILFRVMINVYFGIGTQEAPIHPDVFLALSVLAAAAMIIGNALALRQKNIKRLLAYSGIANAGYLLVPMGTDLSPLHAYGFSEVYFYLIAYVFMNIGIFAVLMAVSRTEGHEEMSGFSGLYYRAPWTSAAAVILVLSLAGLPVTGGFFGKLYILLGTMQVREYWLGAIMILTSVVSFYYYFSMIRQMFMRPARQSGELKLTGTLRITIWLCAACTLLLGFMPHWVLGAIDRWFQLEGDFFVFL